jgi:hypothetical protein
MPDNETVKNTIGAQARGGSTICLVAIVRNESEVIARCLRAIKPFVGTYCITDTGSTDDTIDVIRDTMGDMAGVVQREPWRDFPHNRTQAIRLAQSCLARGKNFLLFADADEIYHFEDGFTWGSLDKDCYDIEVRYGSLRYRRPVLVKACHDWHYRGVVHEFLSVSSAKTRGVLEKCWIEVRPDGFRSQNPSKFQDDAKLLVEAIAACQQGVDTDLEPRYWFYLAQSHRDCGAREAALEAYKHRAQMVSFDQETYYAMLQVADLMAVLGYPKWDVIQAYLKAHAYRPCRVESLTNLARFCRLSANEETPGAEGSQSWQIAYLAANTAAKLPPSTRSNASRPTSPLPCSTPRRTRECTQWHGRWESSGVHIAL